MSTPGSGLLANPDADFYERETLPELPADDWHTATENVAELYDWLTSKGVTVHVPYFLQKPWKWSPEYRAMQAEKARGT